VSFDAATLASMRAGATRAVVFFYLETPDPVRIWSGGGDFAYPEDPYGVETEGAIYRGICELEGLPALDALINGIAQRVDFLLSGVDAEVLALADEDAEDVRGSSVRIAVGFLDAQEQLVSAPLWLRSFEADMVVTNRDADAEGTTTRTIGISVGSMMTGRRRPQISFFTDAHQRRRSSDDRFCERVPLHSTTMVLTWPRF